MATAGKPEVPPPRNVEMGSEACQNLDPADWTEFRRLAHAALDDIIAHVESIGQQVVWQRLPDDMRARFALPLPIKPKEMRDVLDDVRAQIMPFATGNLHPRFMGWVHGAGTPIGMVAEMIAAGLNMNCGGRDHAGIEVERQIVRWMREALGYPDEASGLFVTGSSMANFLAIVVAKTSAIGTDTRQIGLRRAECELVAYTSAEAHGCVSRGMELSGIGSANLRRIAVDVAGRLRVDALREAIARDREAGLYPFLIVATAGTVNTGAIDPLREISEIARQEALWFHVDGAIGALTAFSPALRHLCEGIETSHSIAIDFHKWGHVPYDAGFLLVRDSAAHKRAFSESAAYLQRADRGLAAGETWPCDLGPDLSRGFRALKTWMTFQTLGTERIGDAISHTCELATYLAEQLARSLLFELKAPVALNIVCFSAIGASGEFNRELVMEIQEAGVAVPSWTTLNGELVIRCAIVNHRTTRADIDLFLEAMTALARARLAVKRPPSNPSRP